MNIYVNDQELDAKLTNEKSLEEVYQAVRDWINANKRYILSFQVDQEDISIGELKDIKTDEVERFDFYVGDELDMMLTTLEELDRYVDQIGSTLFEMHELRPEDVNNLQEGMGWIRQILESFSSIMKMELSAMSVMVPGTDAKEGIEELLLRLEEKCQSFSEQGDRKAIESFLDDLRSFKFFIMKMSLQLRTMNAREEELIAALERFDKRIPELVTEITGINESFNAGKDADGFADLERITEELNTYLSALFALDYQMRQNSPESNMRSIESEGRSFYTMAKELTNLLRDLSSALEDNDIVAVGDILEYELCDKLKELPPFLAKIRQFVLAKGQAQ